MATSKFRPEEVPDQVSPAIREYLDRTLQQMSVLLDGAADYLDDELILRAANDETITGAWTFSGDIDVNGDLLGPVNINTAGTDWALRFNRTGVFTGGFYHDLTSQYWLNSAGQTVLQNAYGSKSLVLGDDITIPGGGADQENLIYFNIDRPWLFKQTGSGASCGLALQSVNAGKDFGIEDDAGTEFVRFSANSAGTNFAEVRSAAKFRVLDTSNTKYFDIFHNGTDGILDCSSGILRLANNGGTVSVGGGASSVSISPATVNMSPSGNVNVNPGGNFQFLSGNMARFLDQDNTVYCDLRTLNNSNTSGHNSYIDCSHGSRFRMQSAWIADDSTATFDIGGSYALVFLVTTYNTTTFGMIGFTGTNTPTKFSAGGNIVTGSTNPDTDGKVNIWPSAAGTMSIKNRMGSSRYFYVFSMEP